MGKYGLVLLVFGFSINLYGQEAYKFKLDYDIPESPAFSIVDANPTNVMRGSAAKELAINVVNNFITNSSQETGVALDFNPYFVFGGRLKNIKQYQSSYFKRLLANTQISFASTALVDFPDDNLISAGLRITLFDSFDPLFDDLLGQDIGNALANAVKPPPPGTSQKQYDVVTLQELKTAYEKAQERVKNKKGGALSIGAAIAQRAQGGVLSNDSLIHFRDQYWLSGQYNFGNGINLLGLAMYRNTAMEMDSNIDETVLGLGIRHLGKKVNIGGEIVYSSEKKYLQIGGNIEVKLVSHLLLALSFGNGSEEMTNENNKLIIKPTLRYNLSQSKN